MLIALCLLFMYFSQNECFLHSTINEYDNKCQLRDVIIHQISTVKPPGGRSLTQFHPVVHFNHPWKDLQSVKPSFNFPIISFKKYSFLSKLPFRKLCNRIINRMTTDDIMKSVNRTSVSPTVNWFVEKYNKMLKNTSSQKSCFWPTAFLSYPVSKINETAIVVLNTVNITEPVKRGWFSRIFFNNSKQSLYSPPDVIYSWAEALKEQTWVDGLGLSGNRTYWSTVNFPLLLHTTLTSSLASYNLKSAPRLISANDTSALVKPLIDFDHSKNTTNLIPSGELTAHLLLETALGCRSLDIKRIVSDKAVAIVATNVNQGISLISFRGTKEAVDVITDFNFLSKVVKINPNEEKVDGEKFIAQQLLNLGSQSAFDWLWMKRRNEPKLSETSVISGVDSEDLSKNSQMLAHRGFVNAFESIKKPLQILLENFMRSCKNAHVLMTGHSMGGALAQLAAVTFHEYKPWLVTYGMPAIGNNKFCKFVERTVRPYGGLRVYNSGDLVPEISKPLGFQHAGVEIRLTLTKKSMDKMNNNLLSYPVPGFNYVAPHIIYEIGPALYIFPSCFFETSTN
eukprot:GHVL01031869.1.p1 GENE.GHVL01031869.1~~GHVL01031869.1.p1  ORF type:complete len:567 (+),score=85.60 GHVL01031869.1:1266-2966(+)